MGLMRTLQNYCRGQEIVVLYLYFPLLPIQSLSSCTRGYLFFPRGKVRPGVMLTHHTYLCRGQERVKLYIFSTLRPVQSLSPCTRGYRIFPGDKERPGSCSPTHLLVPWSRNSRAISLLPFTVCAELQCLYKEVPGLSRG